MCKVIGGDKVKIQTILRQWSSSTLDKEHCKAGFDAAKRIDELEEELRCWVSQKGCLCGHPHCSNCRDTTDALNILNN